MTTKTLATRPSPPTATSARGPLVAGGIASAILLLIAIAAWRDPSVSPLTRTDGGPLLAAFLPPGVVIVVAAAASLAGLVVATLAALRPASVGPRTLGGLAAVEVLVLGIGFGSVTAISLAGYLVALAMPLALAVVVVQAIRRYRRVRWVAATLLGLFVVWGLTTAALRLDTLEHLVSTIVTGFGAAGPRLLVAVVVMAATVAWGLVLLAELLRTSALTRAGESVARHRTLWTVTAAVCALPYGLIRLTWLTPWPLLAPGEQDLSADIRLWGLLLGSGSLLGFVLTLGLIRPWGERFPRWVPWLAGRPVPVAAAAVPGGLVAAILCASAAPMLVSLTFTDEGSGLGFTSWAARAAAALVFPFWLWGPSLALAVWGYVVHRRGTPSLGTA